MRFLKAFLRSEAALRVFELGLSHVSVFEMLYFVMMEPERLLSRREYHGFDCSLCTSELEFLMLILLNL
jgi:hypothetical protein